MNQVELTGVQSSNGAGVSRATQDSQLPSAPTVGAAKQLAVENRLLKDGLLFKQQELV